VGFPLFNLHFLMAYNGECLFIHLTSHLHVFEISVQGSCSFGNGVGHFQLIDFRNYLHMSKVMVLSKVCLLQTFSSSLTCLVS
jgi:hypothetical protein